MASQLHTEIHKDLWDIEIKPKQSFLQINFREIWNYRDLLFLLIRRDFISVYKQTLLGPLWVLFQPIMTTAMYFLIFGKVANVSTGSAPPMAFYLLGITFWSYFSETLLKTSDTFIANANIFGKVYFPRLVIPISVVFSNLIKFAIQLLLFLAVWCYYMVTEPDKINANWVIALLPLLILIVLILSLGLGILFSSLTTKYRDLRFLLTFSIQLAMFATPIVYPLSIAPEKYKWLLNLNPLTAVVETARYGFLGSGEYNLMGVLYSLIISVLILLAGIIVFNRVEKTFMDTV